MKFRRCRNSERTQLELIKNAKFRVNEGQKKKLTHPAQKFIIAASEDSFSLANVFSSVRTLALVKEKNRPNSTKFIHKSNESVVSYRALASSRFWLCISSSFCWFNHKVPPPPPPPSPHSHKQEHVICISSFGRLVGRSFDRTLHT